MNVNELESAPCVRRDAFALFLKHGEAAGRIAQRLAWHEPEWSQGLRWYKVASAIDADARSCG